MRVNDRYVSFYYVPDEDRGKVAVERAKTALLVIDMQKVFVERPDEKQLSGKALANYQRWKPFYDKIETVVTPNIQTLLNTFRQRGMEVIFARIVCQKKNGSDRSLDQKATGFNELLLPLGHPAAEIIPQLAPQDDEIVVTKTTDSALTGTSLRLWLHNMGIDTIVATGVFTDQCVSCTVRSLADESFHVWLVEDACMAATQQIQDHELEVLNNIYCHVVNTQEICTAVG